MKAPEDEKCRHAKGCTHRQGVHRKADPRRRIPAYCASCKGGKATHEFTSEAVPA